MTKQELKNQLGAMHFRLLDEPEQYADFVNLLIDYYESSDNYGQAVNSALRDGLDNYERYLKMESALSPRSIVIEKREVAPGMNISRADVEGCYRVSFILDDESKLKMRFDRKQSHLLYILILLCSRKSGFMADFFLSDNNLDTVRQLIKLIYPHLEYDNSAKLMAKELASDRSFSDILQKMKAPLVDCLQQANIADDLYWYMPYAVNLEKKRLYKVHIPQPQIVYPPEFKPIIDALPDASEYIPEESEIEEWDMENKFAWWKMLAERGDADADALYYLGAYYGTGDVVHQDYKKSVYYFEQADQKGCLDATFQLGVYHMFGYGVKKDIRKALTYFERAAANGQAEAATYAGQIYYRGTGGVKVDYHKAFNLYMIAAEQDDEEAICFVILGYKFGQGTKQDDKKAYEWFQKAAALGYDKITNQFVPFFSEHADDGITQHPDNFVKKQSLYDLFISTVQKMDLMHQEDFVQLVDAYRERWHKHYLAEMCKQLSIHKKPDGSGDDWMPERRITIRKSRGGKLPYEIVLTLANGDEVIIDKMKLKSLTLYLLTIICSFKSGYTTMMAADKACRPILKELVHLVHGNSIDNLDVYVEDMMGYEKEKEKKRNEDYYKSYSNWAKIDIKKAVGVRDEVDIFLFDTIRTTGRKMLRRMNLDPQNIDLPPELMDLAIRMPDAFDVLQSAEPQRVME